MSWFERHLNWSLVLGLFYIPLNIGFTIGFLISIVGVIIGLINHGFSYEFRLYLAGLEEALTEQYGTVLGIVALLLCLAGVIVVTLWYLGKKGRSKGFVLLLIAPPVVGFLTALTGSPFFIMGGIIIAFAGPIIGLIILLLLQNKTVGVDFAADLVTDRWPDTGHHDAPDTWQPKELDYKYVEDIKDVGGGAKPIPAETSAESPVEVPAEPKLAERVISQEALKMPILLDDAGVVIKCFYHPDAEAVNSCSRCGQYVCSECNYVTGTRPICRSCWDKRAESPILAVPVKKVEPAKKQETPKLAKPKKQEVGQEGWLQEFMLLYEQALPFISIVVRKGDDGLPASPLDLMEGLKLRPMLEQAKKLPKPKVKELQEAKKEFEQLLMACVKVAQAAADFISGGGQTISSGADFTRVADGIEVARGLMDGLYSKLPPFSQPPRSSSASS